MTNSGETASQTVSMITELQGKILKVTFDVSGELSKEMLKILFLTVANNNKSRGQKEIYEMLQSGQPIKCIEIRASGIEQFSLLAKKEKLAFNAVENLATNTCRILFKTEDIEKANKVIEQMPVKDILTGYAKLNNFRMEDVSGVSLDQLESMQTISAKELFKPERTSIFGNECEASDKVSGDTDNNDKLERVLTRIQRHI